MSYRAHPIGEVRCRTWPGRSVVAIRQEDMEAIRVWRNAQLEVLRQAQPIGAEEQQQYWLRVLAPEFDAVAPSQILLSYLGEGGALWGYGGLVHLDWEAGRAEVSFLVAPERTADPRVYRDDFVAFLTLVQRVGFGMLGLARLWTETFDLRPLHVSILEEQGFVLEGRLRGHVVVAGRRLDSLLHGKLRAEWADAG